jgi:ATP-dependent Clp protease ATP-binding subunit ClpA
MSRFHISARLPEEAIRLVDAWAAHLSHIRRTRPSRADAIEYALLRTKPPEDLGETASALRRAHKTYADTKQI